MTSVRGLWLLAGFVVVAGGVASDRLGAGTRGGGGFGSGGRRR